ncbi:MAG TPA: zf-HC2 domain-containing protein [Candidatus Angelobacter sp.]
MTNCEWREKIGPYVDGELEPSAEQAVAGHLQGCSDCTSAVLEQQALKKAVRVAGKRFTAPPELYASVQRQMQPKKSTGLWLKASALATSAALLVVIAFTWISRPSASNATVAQLIDQHVTTLASSNPVDIVNSSHHVVKPWFQGKLPFTFNMPELAGTNFQLIGGKEVFVNQRPGAQLLYLTGQHKVSIFIFQVPDAGTRAPRWNHDFSFTVNSWSADGREYYLVTDGNQTEAGKLVTMFQDANRS